MTSQPVDDYLWDRTGPPDELVEQLELLLAQYRCVWSPPDRDAGAEDGQSADE